MLTIFATPKPFAGHVGVIQRNALGSWVRLHPECQVILFGDEPGSADVAAALGIQHEPDVQRNELGTPLLNHIFARAQEIAAHDLLGYVNCDIVLLRCFCEAVLRVARRSPEFLMVGRRCDVPVTQPLDFQEPDWEGRLRGLAMRSGKKQLPHAVDYFVFSRGLYRDVPPLAIGRGYWDHWLVWKARATKVPVVDASAALLAVHQNHDYSHYPGGAKGVTSGVEAKRNRALAGGQWHLYTIEHATHQFVAGGIERKPGRWHMPFTFFLRTYSSQFWYWILKATFKSRHALGLHRGSVSQVEDWR